MDILSLHLRCFESSNSKFSGFTMYIVSSMSQLRKALFMFIWWSFKSQWTTSVIISLKESFVETVEKASLKSIPSFWVNSFAIEHVLYLSMLPLGYHLILKIYLQPISFAPLGNLTRSQTSLRCIDIISSFMAPIYWS